MSLLESLETIDGVSQAVVNQVQALFDDFVEGRYVFDNNVFLNAESYQTKCSDEKDFEAHRKYIDVQIIVSGQEIIEVASVDDCSFKIIKPYVYDIEFMNGDVKKKEIELKAGEFCVLYPSDAHKPGINFGDEHLVKKIVIKIPV